MKLTTFVLASALAVGCAFGNSRFEQPPIVQGDLTINLHYFSVGALNGLEADIETVDPLVTKFRVTATFNQADGTTKTFTQTESREQIGETKVVIIVGSVSRPSLITVSEIKKVVISQPELASPLKRIGPSGL